MCENHIVNCRLTCNKKKSTGHLDELQSRLKRQKLPYYTPREVVVHNTAEDCWVSILGTVRDLTLLVEQYQGTREVQPILAFAGKDISSWFDPRTGDILHHVHPETGVLVPYTPHGPIPDVRPHVPTTDWEPLNHLPWWYNPNLVVGYVTRNARPIRIMNMLTNEEATIEVCSEDSLERILERYLMFNTRATGYTWKFEARVLNMQWTLEENHIPDPRPRLRELRLPEDLYTPCLMLYFNDDHSQ